MFTLLAWLYHKASRVYAFFGWLYNRIRDAALYAWDWAKSEASQAYSRAFDWILYYYNRAKDKIADALQTAIDWSVYYHNLLKDLVATVKAILWSRILYYYDLAVSAAKTALKLTAGKLLNTITQAKEWLENVIFIVSQAAKAADILLRAVVQMLINLANARINNLLTAMGADTEEGMKNLVTFFGDPVGWLYAMLFTRFRAFLCWQLASGLGTVKYDLPPAPVFGKPGFGGPYDPPMPIGIGLLVPPLSSLYVSGYTFNNPPGHMGTDFGLQNGDPVFAMHDGIIEIAEWSTIGYGFQVTVRGERWWSRYAHFGDILVAFGQTVKAGHVIGLGNSTGNSTGPHLHLEIKRYGQWVDPLTVL